MLYLLDKKQLKTLQDKLIRRGVSQGTLYASHADNAMFFQVLSEMGFSDQRSTGRRVDPPNYVELGMERVGGPPTTEDIDAYRQATDGGDLGDDAYVVPTLFFDNDLITDRYACLTFNALVDLSRLYQGRSNDFNHQFNVTQHRSRVINLNIGTDPGTPLHPDLPVDRLKELSPMSPFSDVYCALYGDLAFPRHVYDGQYGNLDQIGVIDAVQKGLFRDVSLAFDPDPLKAYCSMCGGRMKRYWFWYVCETHGFAGGIFYDADDGENPNNGKKVVTIIDGVRDAFTFGLVSDGAVKRAMIVPDPHTSDPDNTGDDNSSETGDTVQDTPGGSTNSDNHEGHDDDEFKKGKKNPVRDKKEKPGDEPKDKEPDDDDDDDDKSGKKKPRGRKNPVRDSQEHEQEHDHEALFDEQLDREVEFWILKIDEFLGIDTDLDWIKFDNEVQAELNGRADWNDPVFAVIERGAKKEGGKSKPDSYRHLPHHQPSATDGSSNKTVKLNLLRNALSRMNQIDAHAGDSTGRIRKVAKAHLVKHARALLPGTKYK